MTSQPTKNMSSYRESERGFYSMQKNLAAQRKAQRGIHQPPPPPPPPPFTTGGRNLLVRQRVKYLNARDVIHILRKHFSAFGIPKVCCEAIVLYTVASYDIEHVTSSPEGKKKKCNHDSKNSIDEIQGSRIRLSPNSISLEKYTFWRLRKFYGVKTVWPRTLIPTTSELLKHIIVECVWEHLPPLF